MTAIRATYINWVMVKTRSAVQLVFEIDASQADLAYKVLGGMPQTGSQVEVGIARLQSPVTRATGTLGALPATVAAGQEKPRAKQKWSDMKLAQRAALMCADETSWPVLAQDGKWYCENLEDASAVLRKRCNVKSRAEFDTDPAAAERYLAIEKQWLQHKADQSRYGP